MCGGEGFAEELNSYNVHNQYRLNINSICENLFLMCLCMYGVAAVGGGGE